MFISIILLYDGIIVLTMYVKYVNTDHICNMLCFRHSAYVVKADVMPLINLHWQITSATHILSYSGFNIFHLAITSATQSSHIVDLPSSTGQ